MTLTVTDITETVPKSGVYDLHDQRGLYLRVFPSGRRSWRVKVWEKGRERTITLGQYPDMGLEKAREERDRLRLAKAQRTELTLEQFAQVYIDHWARPRKRSWRLDQRMLERNIIPAMVVPKGRRVQVRLGDRPITQITGYECAQVTDPIIARGATEMAARVYSCLRRVFHYAVERETILASPASRMKVRQGRSRQRALGSQEIAEWWPVFQRLAPPAPRIAASLILATLQRPGEVLELEHAEIDRLDHLWRMPGDKAKNRQGHDVPLTPWAITLICEARSLWPNSKRVVPVSADTVRAYMTASWQEAGIERVTPHDLRRTGATTLGKLGVPRIVQDKILNHVDHSTTGIYDRYPYLDEQRQALERWAERFSTILQPGSES